MATTTQKPLAGATAITTTPSSVTVAAANSSSEPYPKKTMPSYTDKSDPPTTVTLSNADGTVKGIEGSKTTETTVGSDAEDSSGPVNDIQKKMRRAERFGVPVQLSEQEKRNSRAERFGTAPSSKGSEASEEVKRKARAERFGLAVPSTAVDEEEKKKARLARFAPYA